MARRPVKPRRYTVAETLQAIARMLNAPRPGGIGLALVDEVTGLAPGRELPAQAKLTSLADLHGLRRWADALDTVTKVRLYKGFGDPGYINAAVTGRIPRGPVVEVSVWVRGLRLEQPWEPGEQMRDLTLGELHALDDARPKSGRAR